MLLNGHTLLLAHSTEGVALNHAHAAAGPKEVPDVVDAVELHRGPLERKSPCDSGHIRGQTHGPKHLRSEDAAVAYLDPLVKTLDVRKYFHGWLSIRIVSWFEPDGGHAKPLKKLLKNTDEIAKAYVSVYNDSLNLMELRQMSFVDAFITKHAVNAEVFPWRESTKAKSAKNPAGNSSRVRA